MSEVSPVYTPSEWGDQAYFYQGIEDRAQRRALALIGAFGSLGGGDRVCFVADQIVIAAPAQPQGDGSVDLVVRPLDEFIADYSRHVARDGDPRALRWIEKIVHWPELGC
jgi:hypothetical protein